MQMATRKEYLKAMRERYQRASRKEKSQLLNEVIAILEIHRKHAVRTLNVRELKRSLPRTRKYTYDIVLAKPLKQIWEVAGRPCSKRLEPQMGMLIRQLKKFDELKITAQQEEQLCSMSNWTIDQLLTPERERLRGKGITGTRRSPLLKSLIPIRTSFELETGIGNLEMDTVLHCGESVAGEYGVTVNMLDIATHWNERRMVMKKTQGKVVGSFHRAKTQFPFLIRSVDFDNGDEFVNWCMHGYCKRHAIAFTRSRPYQKNDQAHIEGKNFQSVRKVTGYGRITEERVIELFNDIYENEHRLLTNFFYSTLKLKIKENHDGKTKKRHEEARTPYQRVLQSKEISSEIKQQLRAEYQRLNPAQLQRSLQKKLTKIRRMLG